MKSSSLEPDLKFHRWQCGESGAASLHGLGQLTEEFQEHSGAVNTGTSPSVQYVFSEMVSSANHSRLVRTVYPNGRIVRSEYGTVGGLNDRISRLEYLADDAGGSIGTHLEELSYLGVNTVVRRAHPEPGVDLTYIKQTGESNGDAGDKYIGLDRFGRVVDQRWIDTGTLTETDRFGYGHDRNGNRQYRENLLDAAFSELYHEDGSAGGYDLLNRLTDFQRGTLNGTKDTIATASREQVWNLDALGNWDSLATDGGAAQTRTHNAQNQVTGVNGQTSPTFDNNGNTTTDETGKKFAFDAWNRLREVRDGSNNLLETLSYDALKRRIVMAPQAGTARALYYSADWQVVEERESGLAVVQNVWSPVYVDALILRDRDTDANGSLDERMYVQQDANFNVAAIINTTGVVQERYIYDPYGKASYLDANFTSRASSNFNWLYLHQGGRLDLLSALYHFRHRDLSPTLGRWLQQDPLGYVDGMNLYENVRSNPAKLIDPRGLKWWEWVPLVSTAGHYFSDVAGDEIADYPNLTPTKRECRQAPELAIKKCKDGINAAAAKFLSQWLGVGIGADLAKGLFAGVVDTIAVWAIKNGVKGGIGGAVTGGVLTVDAAVDTALVLDGAWGIYYAATAATEKYCKCC